MDNVVYRVVFDAEKMPKDAELTKNEELVSKDTKDVKETSETKEKSLVDSKVIAKIGTIYNLTSNTLNFTTRVESVGYELKGDFIMAQKTQNNFSTAREITNIGFMLGAGFAIGGPAGVLAVGSNLALSYGFKALTIGLENRKLIDQIQTQKYLGSIEQQRFVRNSTTEMIR